MLAANPTSATGTYTIDPDGPGGSAPFTTRCEMTSDGGGWTLLAPGYLSTLASASRKYLFRCEGQCTGAVALSSAHNDAWYESPATLAVWSWSTPAQVAGTWRYGGAGVATSSFSCVAPFGGDVGYFGVYCEKPVPGGRVLPWPAIGFTSDATAAETGLCQDYPGIFGTWASGQNNACVAHVRVYERAN